MCCAIYLEFSVERTNHTDDAEGSKTNSCLKYDILGITGFKCYLKIYFSSSKVQRQSFSFCSVVEQSNQRTVFTVSRAWL